MADEQNIPAPDGASTKPSTVTGVAAPAAIGVGAVTVTGAPTAWLWNDLLAWFVGGMKGTLPVMPEPVAMFFGGLLMAAAYGVYRWLSSR